jgi:hypothetical protein
MAGGDKPRLETTKCRMAGVGIVYRGRKLQKGRTAGVGIETEVGTTKGWVCGVAEKDSGWLGSLTGPHTKEVWT